MKLSEAIRAGAIYPDCHGPVYGPDGISCCAIGGALRAAGMPQSKKYSFIDRAYELWPMLSGNDFQPPKGAQYNGTSMLCCLIGLFERNLWSKKAIAEWVEVIENKLEAESRAVPPNTENKADAVPSGAVALSHSPEPASISL